MSTTAIISLFLLTFAVIELIDKGSELRKWIAEFHRDLQLRQRYKRIRDTNYYLYSIAKDECSRIYYYKVYREYADKLIALSYDDE
ncbi:MAG: hypothetical protein IJ874_09330 [Ruminococcus sp.]|nr:hypothetical protein [Ruminococcus sp.]